jgi:hypothetical protein
MVTGLDSLDDFLPEASSKFKSLFGQEPGWLWKDPRLAVLIPFWENITGPCPILVPYRSPQAVAQSIAARDGISYEQGLAVWEMNLRAVLSSLHGRRTLILSYEYLLANPIKWTERLADFCEDSGISVTRPSGDQTNLFISPESSNQGSLEFGQQFLVMLLADLAGAHESFGRIDLPPPSDHTLALLDQIQCPEWSIRS